MTLIVCNSVFQLYVAVILKKTFLNGKKVDLVLTDATPCFSEMCHNYRLQELFENVFYREINKNAQELNRILKSRYGKVLFEIFPKMYVKRVWKIETKQYDECFFSTYIRPNIFLQHAIKRNNKDNQIHMYEDGISTYLLGNSYQYLTPKFLRKIFNVSTIEALVDDLYLLEPDLLCLNQYKNIKRIPRPKECPEVEQLLDEIFISEKYDIKEKFVFFEESFNNDGHITNDADLINSAYESVGQGEFILKNHPRNKVNRFKSKLPIIETPIFWEKYILDHSIDHKVLITVSSNTVFVPHILCGCEPTVIMLYKLFDGTSPIFGSGKYEDYVDRYRKLYGEYTKEKFFVPETIEEFYAIVNSLKEQ